MKDMKGVDRYECSKCGDECDEYMFTPTGPCGYCSCPPIKHSKTLSSTPVKSITTSSQPSSESSPAVYSSSSMTVNTSVPSPRAPSSEISPTHDQCTSSSTPVVPTASSVLQGGKVLSVEKRKRIIESKRIKLHSPEEINSVNGEKRKRKLFENDQYLEMMQHKNMRSLDKVALRGIVGEKYAKYSAEKQLLAAKDSSHLLEKIETKLAEDAKAVKNRGKLRQNIDRLEKAIATKKKIHNELKRNFERRLCKDDHNRKALRQSLEGQMSVATTEMRKATDALRKACSLTTCQIQDLLVSEDDCFEEYHEESDGDDQNDELAKEIKAEGSMEAGAFSAE